MGLTGAAGAPGPQGKQGAQGPAGPAGANGKPAPTCTATSPYLVVVQGVLVCQQRFTANGDGTLTDNQTGLMWELQTAACRGEATCSANSYSWSAGASDTNQDGTLYTQFLATLNANTGTNTRGSSACFANYCDWRIPNVVELQTIVDASATGCKSGSACIDGTFGTTRPDQYWASTTYAGNPAEAWYVGFGDVGVSSNAKSYAYSARAVRGGQ